MFNRSLWRGRYGENGLPKFPCPSCSKGILIKDKETYFKKFPNVPHEEFDASFQQARFSCLLVCDKPHCSEVVALTGNFNYQQVYDNEEELVEIEDITPLSMTPGSPIIEIPAKTPTDAKTAIIKSFSLYWSDKGSAANKLRIAVECIMGHQQVPVHHENGKRHSLDARIKLFGKIHPEYESILDALRLVGNLGSHSGEVSAATLLDAYEIFHDCLMDLYGGRRARIDGIAKKIKDTGGKYK